MEAEKLAALADEMERVWDVLKIKNLMGRQAYFHAYGMRDRVLDELWAAKPENRATASLGQNCGYQVGFDNIRKNYVDNFKAREEKGVNNIEMEMYALTTPYVFIAADRKTAKGMWYVPGHFTAAKGDSAEASWKYLRYAADFVNEDGQWRIWHLFMGTDFVYPVGADIAETQSPEVQPDVKTDGARYDIELEAYTPRYNWSSYPPLPKPYDTFTDQLSYGPEGNPALKKEAV